MKALLSIFLFLAIIAPGEPLRCIGCVGHFLHKSSCQMQSTVYCNANKTMCMSGAMRTNMIRAKKTHIKYATCVKPGDFILGDYSLTSANNKYFHYMAGSCDTDKCNTIPEGISGISRQSDSVAPPTNSGSSTNDTVEQPPSEEGAPMEEPGIGPALDFNGRQCPSCFSDNVGECENAEIVRCYGDETQCIDLFGTINVRDAGMRYIRFQGCATPEQCDMTEEGIEPSLTMSEFMPIHVECSDAQPSSD